LILREVIRTRMHVVLHGAGGEHEVIAFGILIVAIMIFMPEGLTAGTANLIRKLKRKLVAGD
jgi:ABC-type branched-subunit amino acid transport system permease subunit